MSRVLLSPRLKQRIRQDDRSQGELASLAGLNVSQLCVLMRDQTGIGPVVRARIIALGQLLGVVEDECFREVRR